MRGEILPKAEFLGMLFFKDRKRQHADIGLILCDRMRSLIIHTRAAASQN